MLYCLYTFKNGDFFKTHDGKINHSNPWKRVTRQALLTPIQNPKWLPSPGTMAWQSNSLQYSGAESWVCCCHDLLLTQTCCHDSKIHTIHSIQMRVIKTDHMQIVHPLYYNGLCHILGYTNLAAPMGNVIKIFMKIKLWFCLINIWWALYETYDDKCIIKDCWRKM